MATNHPKEDRPSHSLHVPNTLKFMGLWDAARHRGSSVRVTDGTLGKSIAQLGKAFPAIPRWSGIPMSETGP
jgi:hypothetical protein